MRVFVTGDRRGLWGAMLRMRMGRRERSCGCTDAGDEQSGRRSATSLVSAEAGAWGIWLRAEGAADGADGVRCVGTCGGGLPAMGAGSGGNVCGECGRDAGAAADGARGRECRRVVYTSSVATMGFKTDGTIVDEGSPVSVGEMIGHYKRSKFVAEQVAIEAARDGPARDDSESDDADWGGGREAYADGADRGGFSEPHGFRRMSIQG